MPSRPPAANAVRYAELHSLSNEESAATPAGMDYPFLDNGEGGGSAWTAGTPQGVVSAIG